MSPLRRLGLLAALYFSQGLPYGFFTLALPAVLRQRGVDLATIGAANLLLLPWALKFLWAPAVDRAGRHKPWIVGLQGAAVLVLLGLAGLDPGEDLRALAFGMLALSALAATQDVATDALAVRLLPPSERGVGNGLQVAGYRLGMIVGGTAVLLLYATVGPSAAFVAMAVLLALATVPVVLHPEAPRTTPSTMPTLRGLVAAASRPGMGRWWALLVLYKAGDGGMGALLKPFLVDAGLDLPQIGAVLGLGGSVAGLLGALVGGFGTGRLSRRAALVGFGALQAAAGAGIAAVAGAGAPVTLLIAAVFFEHFASGTATAALFTRMMDRCRIGSEGTDYTLQASAVVLATGLAGSVSGAIAAGAGYPTTFAACAALSAFAAVLSTTEREAP